jgi:hypothetical protein
MGLYEKIYNVMCESEALEKSMVVGSGSFSYKAISEAAVLNAIKPLLKKHKLIIIPVSADIKELVDSFETAKGNTTRLMTQISATYKIIDIETGESEILATVGNGADTQDTGSGKAWTYAYKALIQKTFCLFSGEDTDNEHSNDMSDKNTVDPVAKDVKLITLKMVQDRAKEKGVSDAQILARLNNNTPEKEHIKDINLLTQAQLNGLYKVLNK